MKKYDLIKGEELDRFCASVEEKIVLDRTYFGADDGITPAPADALSAYHAYGNRGEGIYLLKTVYTDIKLDGEMDPAYTYGIHIRGDLYNDKSLYGEGEATCFDGYIVRGQDGRIYVYAEVTDREIVVNDYFFFGGGASYHADSLDFFYDTDNGGSCFDSFTMVADPTGKYTRGVKPEGAVRITEKGYAVEFAFDNHGKPFISGDELGFGFYLNDVVDFDKDTKAYKRVKIKNATVLAPHSMGYVNPSGELHDGLRVSLESATGRVEIKDPPAQTVGDVLTDIFRNNARVAVIYDRNATVQSIMQAKRASVTPCSVTVTDWKNPGCMCLIYQLSNGHFVIVDSDGNGMHHQIYNVLRSKAPDGRPVVESWIITHFHGDHLGGFISYTGCEEYMRDTEIRTVISNHPQKQVLDMAYYVDRDNMELWYNDRVPSMKANGTVFYRARAGQKFYFGNAEIEMLWTYEDIMPFSMFVDRSNPTSIGFTVKLCGQKMMVTGDSSGEEFTIACKKFGKTLKSDLVQLSHHGQGDGYSPAEFYRTVAAPYVINPGIGDYYGIGEAWARDNCEKYLMRLDLGCFTVPLPYDGGSVESTRGQ